MRAVLAPGDGTVRVDSIPLPEPGVGDVRVRVGASAICGSDRSVIDGGALLGDTGAAFTVPGHEVAGTVERIGPGVTALRPGDRVALHVAVGCGRCRVCRSGHPLHCPTMDAIGFTRQGGDAEFIVVPAATCLLLPDGIGLLEGALATDMFGTQYSAQRRAGVTAGETVLVSGLGPMGLAAVATAHAFGARVIAVDPHEERRAIAMTLGAVTTFEPSEAESTSAVAGAIDVVVECSGNPRAQSSAFDLVAPRGRVVYVGESAEVTLEPSRQLLRTGATLFGAWYFPAHEFPDIVRFLQEKRVPVSAIVSHRFGLDDAEEAFALLGRRGAASKMVFEV